ncbi:MAG: trypco2 family protein [Sphingomonas sp.]
MSPNSRTELATAIAAGKDEELRFVASNIELQLEIGAETKADGSGKLSFKVFGIGAEGGGGVAHGSNSGQRITLSLSLVDKAGKPPFIGADATNSRT